MKSTPMRGVKENLKPDAYKQSELRSQKSEARSQKSGMILAFWLLASGFWVTAYLLYNGSAS